MLTPATWKAVRRVGRGKARIVPAADTLPRVSVPMPDLTDDGTEEAIHARSHRTREAETAPPTFPVFRPGTLRADRSGELDELRRFTIKPPGQDQRVGGARGQALQTTESCERSKHRTIQKYVGWIRAGHRPPPQRRIERAWDGLRRRYAKRCLDF